jgi:uroporphyrinogen-III synthase
MMNLAGTRVLVTRPEHQAHDLIRAIRKAGGVPVPFPVLAIKPSRYPAIAADNLASLGEYKGLDILIFVSPNAVDNALPLLPPQGTPAEPRMAAVGLSTAATMEQAGLSVDIVPRGSTGSDALLKTEEMQDVKGKHVIIVRGEGGRNHLGKVLEQRGAMVQYAEVYRRTLPDDSPKDQFSALCVTPGLDLCLATSNQSIKNLYELAGEQGCPQLLSLPLIVVSERGLALARELGFCADVLVAHSADDDSLLEAIDAWRAGNG